VGNVTAKRMHQIGIHNGLDLRNCPFETLVREFGKAGLLYYNFARGNDDRAVEPTHIRKSVGCERTLEHDITSNSSIIIELYHTAAELVERVNKVGFHGNTLTLKIKFNDFTQITRCVTQSHDLRSMKVILPIAKQLVKKVEGNLTLPIRLIGLTVSNNQKESSAGYCEQLSLDF
jgi:DNA polymerase-4